MIDRRFALAIGDMNKAGDGEKRRVLAISCCWSVDTVKPRYSAPTYHKIPKIEHAITNFRKKFSYSF